MDRITLPQDFKDLLRLLHAHGVKHLLIGGWAVAHYGHPRNTKDIDIWIAVDPANLDAVIQMMREFIGVAPSREDFEKRPLVLRMGVPPNRVELITDISGVEFDACYKNRVESLIDGEPVTLIGFQDLLSNKRASARDQDLIDVKRLEKFKALLKRKQQKKHL
jgi:hypothetical protein